MMGLYTSPELRASVSPSLKKRMQGKSCFNFSSIDERLFAELADLTRRVVPADCDQAAAHA
jgi:hypothetical protein